VILCDGRIKGSTTYLQILNVVVYGYMILNYEMIFFLFFCGSFVGCDSPKNGWCNFCVSYVENQFWQPSWILAPFWIPNNFFFVFIDANA
jgi:hypothetical protein